MRLPSNQRDDIPATDEKIPSRNANRPISADETLRAVGYLGLRKAWFKADLWRGPNVRPAIATTGIRVGDTIVALPHGIGRVTRVGTIAGWMVPNHGPNAGEEVRWDVGGVTRIIPRKEA